MSHENTIKYSRKDDCIACGGTNLNFVLDLGLQPSANSFKKNKNDQEDFYPLAVNVCSDCSHLQLSHLVHQDELFKHYVYVSGTSKTQLNYFKWFADIVAQKLPNNNNRILDVGCNDGSQLNYFKELGFNTYGVDPAKNLYEVSSKQHHVVCDYFNSDSVMFDTPFSAIICQNAFAHNYDQLQFLQKCKSCLCDDGLIFISISQATMVQNGEFDTIYHEHYSYYNVKSMKAICDRAGLFLIDVMTHPIHGNTYIFVLSNTNTPSNSVKEMISAEDRLGMSDPKTYENYAFVAKQIAKKFKSAVDEMKSLGYPVIGYGSPAKGNTMLNFSGVTLDFIVDDNPLKQGSFTPGSSIHVLSSDSLKNLQDIQPVCFVPLAWNFFDEIHHKISNIRNGKTTLYIKYFPDFKVFNDE